MKQALRRWISRLLKRLAHSPRLKSIAKRSLERVPRLRGLVLRLMHGGSLFGRQAGINRFEPLSDYQQRLTQDLHKRWGR